MCHISRKVLAGGFKLASRLRQPAGSMRWILNYSAARTRSLTRYDVARFFLTRSVSKPTALAAGLRNV